MYTAPKPFTEDQLHARIPLGVATWHAHVNICMPARDIAKPDYPYEHDASRIWAHGAAGKEMR